MDKQQLPCGTSPHWVCYVAMGKQLAAGPFHDDAVAKEHAADIGGYEAVTQCWIWSGDRPPRGWITLEAAVGGCS
jgi:hypothetical protein